MENIYKCIGSETGMKYVWKLTGVKVWEPVWTQQKDRDEVWKPQ